MRWFRGVLLAMLVSCGSTPPRRLPVPTPERQRPSEVPSASRWPDVGAQLASDGGGTRDAALIVAIEHYAKLPVIAGARRNGVDWARFLTDSLGVPRTRVAVLDDAQATRGALVANLTRAASQVEAGGRLWFVFIGHGGEDLVPIDGGDALDARRRLPVSDVLEISARSSGQPVLVLDIGFDRDLLVQLGTHVDRRPPGAKTRRSPIVMEGNAAGFLPGAERPAFSYLLLGALRGWADKDADGGVTAEEAVRFTHSALQILRVGRLGSRPELSTPLDCRSLTTLSTFAEQGPHLADLAPRPVPPRPQGSPSELRAAEAALREADGQLHEAYARYKDTSGKEGIVERRGADLEPVDEHQRKRPDDPFKRVRQFPIPDVVLRTSDTRVTYAALLGGPENPEAARLLEEAARTYYFYGHLDRALDLDRPVVDARCSVDQSGFQAWQFGTSAAYYLGDRSVWKDLATLECQFDEWSEEQVRHAAGALPEPGAHNARDLLDQTEKQTDPDVARCYWSTGAAVHSSALLGEPGPFAEEPSKPEAALNGAYAFRAIDETDAAARLLQTFVGASTSGPKAEDPKIEEERHKFSAKACDDFLSLAKATPRWLPGYFDVCIKRDWRSCEDGDIADCVGVCPGDVRRCVRWADHADAGIGVPRDEHTATSVRKAACDLGDISACERITAMKLRDSRASELERLVRDANDRLHRASGLEELAEWETGNDRVAMQRRALDEFRASESAWHVITDRPRDDHDAAQSLLRLAEARYSIVTLLWSMGVAPTPQEIANARTAALAVRDSSFGELRKDAGKLLIDLADRAREEQEGEFERTHGAQGLQKRTEARFSGQGDFRQVMRDELPTVVLDAVRARDDYAALVAPTDDLERTRARYALEAAGIYFVYGDFAEARRRLEKIRSVECGRDAVGFEAWVMLLSIHTFEHDSSSLRKLIALPSCALDAETRRREEDLLKPQYGPGYVDVYGLLTDTARLRDEPARREKLKEEVARFQRFIEQAPSHAEAPRATLATAHAYEELAERDRAIGLYETFVDRYGSESALTALEKGVPGATPPVAPDKWHYAERLHDLAAAYQELAELRLSANDYRRAALACEAESARKRLPKNIRLDAARKAVTLAASRGASGMLTRLAATLAELGAPPVEQRRAAAVASRARAALDASSSQ